MYPYILGNIASNPQYQRSGLPELFSRGGTVTADITRDDLDDSNVLYILRGKWRNPDIAEMVGISQDALDTFLGQYGSVA